MRNNSRRRFCLGDQYCVWFWALTTLGRYPTHSPKLPLSASKKLKAAKLLNWAKVSQGQLQRQPGKYVAFSTTSETCECDPTWPYLHDPTDWQTFLSKKTAGTTAESVMCIWVYFAIGAIQGVGRHWRNCRWRSTCNFWCCRRGFYLGTQFGVLRLLRKSAGCLYNKRWEWNSRPGGLIVCPHSMHRSYWRQRSCWIERRYRRDSFSGSLGNM